MLAVMLAFAIAFSSCGTNTRTVTQADGKQTALATKSAIHGAWEMRKDGFLHVTYFSEGGIFIAYRDGFRLMDGHYSLRNITPNQQQKIKFEWSEPLGLDDIEFDVTISGNELVITGEWPDRPFLPPLHIVEPGTHRRSSFVLEEGGNPLVGVWKSQSQILRFYRAGQGLLSSYQNEPAFAENWQNRFSYEFSSQSGSGRISLLDWEWNVDRTDPFVVNGNVLRIEGVTAEFIKQ